MKKGGGRVHACNIINACMVQLALKTKLLLEAQGGLWSISFESDKSATRVRRVVCCPYFGGTMYGCIHPFDTRVLRTVLYTHLSFHWIVRTYAQIFMYSLSTSLLREKQNRVGFFIFIYNGFRFHRLVSLQIYSRRNAKALPRSS